MMQNDPSPQQASTAKPAARSIALILVACAAGALAIFLVCTERFVFGSAAGNWVYPYFKRATDVPLWIPALALALLGLMIFLGARFIRTHERAVLVGCFLLALAVQFLVGKAYPIALWRIIQSDTENSFYVTALRYSPVDVLTQYESLAPTFPLHAKANMPGKVLLYGVLTPVVPSPKMIGYAVLALSSLGMFLLYAICKKLFEDQRAAFFAFILYALIPGRLFFFPILNTVTPVLLLLCLFLTLKYLEHKHVGWPWLLGAALYLLVLFEPAPLVTGLVFVGILVNAGGANRLTWKECGSLLLNTVAAFLCVYLAFYLIFSFDLLQAFRFVLQDAAEFNASAGRGYWVWLGPNLSDFLFGVGVPIAVIVACLVLRLGRQWKTRGFDLARWPTGHMLVLSLLVTLAIVLLLGINRGEVIRLWIYLAVLFQIPAAYFVAAETQGQVPFFLVAATLLAQSFLTLQRVRFMFP